MENPKRVITTNIINKYIQQYKYYVIISSLQIGVVVKKLVVYFKTNVWFHLLDCGHEIQHRGFVNPKIAFGNVVKRHITVSLKNYPLQ